MTPDEKATVLQLVIREVAQVEDTLYRSRSRLETLRLAIVFAEQSIAHQERRAQQLTDIRKELEHGPA